MISRGTSWSLSRAGGAFNPVNTKTSHFATPPSPRPPIPWGGSMKLPRQKRGEGSVPCCRHHPAAPAVGALALGGISRPTYSQMPWGREEWKAPLSLPLIPRKAFAPGKETVACAQPPREPSPDIWLGEKVRRGDPLAFLQPREAENPGSSQTHAEGRATQEPRGRAEPPTEPPPHSRGTRGSCRR